MSSMFFKSILIADVRKHTARFVSFNKGLNVITSSENHVGKSSVIKSLYDTLGAEVHFDARWDKNSKLTVVSIDVDGTQYQVVRFNQNFAIFKEDELVLLTNSVTKKLAPKLAEIFNFSVFLNEKNGTKTVVQAPPAFTLMPYYIDQDKGWNELYNSFDRMEQFSKQERVKSLYFHLGIYTKSRIELLLKKEQMNEKIAELQKEEFQLSTTVKALNKELNNIIPSDNEDSLERYLSTPKKEIADLVLRIGLVRNSIQELCSSLLQHENQLKIILHYQQKMQIPRKTEKEFIHVCPKCGYEFDDELYNLVRTNYNQSNTEYLRTQVELIVDNIRAELKKQEQQYIALMSQLREQEKVYDESQNAYDVYLRHRGLKGLVQKFYVEITNNRTKQSEYEEEVKKIKKELNNVPNRKEIEKTYVNFVKKNIIELNAWTPEYEGKIKLLKSLKSQGSLLPKIILSQYNAIFQTMSDMNIPVIRFPFVVDSPRNKEPSVTSSKDILRMIMKITSLPQIILATVDFDAFCVENECNVNKIFFDSQFSVLNEAEYNVRKEKIEELYHLLTSDCI